MSLSNVISIASTATSLLHYAQRSAWASFITGPLQTISSASDHGNNTFAAPLTQRIQYTSAMTASTSGITVGVSDFTITQAGRYRIAFEVEVEDSVASQSMGTVVQVIKNGIILTKAKARPSHDDPGSQYITTNPNGVISVDLIVGDVIDFRIAAMNTTVNKDITGYNIDIVQEASSTVVDQSAIVVTDQAANGYVDIGAMRIQWGTFTTIGGSGSIVFPVPFSLVPVITGNVILPTMTSSSRSVVFSTVSNTGSIVASVTGAGVYSNNNVAWTAIGLK